jgi:hypothetical protein
MVESSTRAIIDARIGVRKVRSGKAAEPSAPFHAV